MENNISDIFKDCMDYQQRSYCDGQLEVVYLSTLIGNDELVREVLHPFFHMGEHEILELLSRPPFQLAHSLDECIRGILEGKAVSTFKEKKISG